MAFWLVRPDWTTHHTERAVARYDGYYSCGCQCVFHSAEANLSLMGQYQRKFAMAAFKSWTVSRDDRIFYIYTLLTSDIHVRTRPAKKGAWMLSMNWHFFAGNANSMGWAMYAPMNCQNRFWLVKALIDEMLRLHLVRSNGDFHCLQIYSVSRMAIFSIWVCRSGYSRLVRGSSHSRCKCQRLWLLLHDDTS